MLHVVDNLLPADLLEALRQLCVVHGELKQTHPGDALLTTAVRARSMPSSSDS